jgi:pimeloyl-ACP methyl ester carboxylesterase
MTAIADHHRGGDGPPLLLIHGFTATWRVWSPVIELLEPQFDLFAPTLAGHTGGPDISEGSVVPAIADSLEAMLDEIGWTRCHVAGFSLGGQLALEMGKRGRALDVTAICPGGAHGDHMTREWRRVARLFRRQHGAAVRLARVATRLGRYPAARRMFMRDLMVDGSRVSREDSNAMTEAFAATPVFAPFLATGPDERALRGLEQIDVPVTVVWGDKDRTLPQAKHEPYFREHLRDARFVTLKRVGHVPFWDAPERVADVIAQTALASERKQVATA